MGVAVTLGFKRRAQYNDASKFEIMAWPWVELDREDWAEWQRAYIVYWVDNNISDLWHRSHNRFYFQNPTDLTLTLLRFA